MNITMSLLALLSLIISMDILANEETKPQFAADSEIYLFDLTLNNGVYTLKNAQNISNNSDYDSQPYFMPDSNHLLFSSSRDGKQTDIYEYNLLTQKTIQLTDTKHSEFAPKPVGKTGDVSFVSEGFNPYQSVWKLDRKTGKQSWLLNSKEPVGYYQLDEPSGDVIFWSRYGWSIQYLNIKDNVNRFVTGNALPSTPQKIPESNRFSFVHRQTNSMLWIKSFDPQLFSITHVAPIYGNNYEYGWAPNGDILRFENNKLFVWPKNNKEVNWLVGQDLSTMVKGDISRITISNNGKYLALVVTQKP